MSIEKNRDNGILIPSNINPQQEISELQNEIEAWISFEEIRWILNQDIQISKIDDYLNTFEKLTYYYWDNENYQELFIIWKEKIINLVKILDTLIQIIRIKEENIDEKKLYEQWDIESILKYLWIDIVTLDHNAFWKIEVKLNEILEKNNNMETNPDNLANSTTINPDFLMPTNRIQTWYEELTWENIPII